MKIVQRQQLAVRRTCAQNQVQKAQERERALDARRRKLEIQYDEAVSTLSTKRNDVGNLSGIIRRMDEIGAVGYAAEDGMIQEWVMPDGSRKDASVEVD